MTPSQAEALIKQEVASGSQLGTALLLFLEDAELQNYRQSARTTDPYTTAVICGRGQGINSIINRIAPTEAPAPNRAVPQVAAGVK